MKYEFEPAWVPDAAERAGRCRGHAIAWTDSAAAGRRSTAVLVTDQINEYYSRELFDQRPRAHCVP